MGQLTSKTRPGWLATSGFDEWMAKFLELRAWMAKQTSPIAADAVIALVVAGAATGLLRAMFQ